MKRKSDEGKNNAGGNRGVRRLLNVCIILLVAAVLAAVCWKLGLLDNLTFGSGGARNKTYSLYGDIGETAAQLETLSASSVKNRDPVYVLDLDRFVAPKPDPTKYDEKFENYSDPTIEAHYHRERMYNSYWHFIEVKIKHPSQFRQAFVNDAYGKYYKLPSALAAEVNAVVAVNSDFYNRRAYGTVLYKRVLYRYRPRAIDLLLIDSEGNFHIVDDRELKTCGLLEEYDIIHGLSFGPALVMDHQALTITKRNWEPRTLEPRTAICQYDDDLHYLIVQVEGRMLGRSDGVTTQTLADELAKKGVRIAYNLDGGQSGTIIFGNHVKNRVAYGGEKYQGNILYFATALEPEQQPQ